MTDSPAGADRATVTLLPKHDKRLRQGHPWVYSNEIRLNTAVKTLPPGSVVRLANSAGEPLGTAIFNGRPLISARLLSRDPALPIDADFLVKRIGSSLALRQRLFPAPYYRLIHAEADGLPGLIVDRFDDVLVAQFNTAGMDRLSDLFLEATNRLLDRPKVLFKNDSSARVQEGLETEVTQAQGGVPETVSLSENGAQYLADLRGGQKTGWFFDQRENRAWIARLSRHARVLDCYCYAGGFAIQAALAGARDVLALDRSQSALKLAEAAAKLNGVNGQCRFEKTEVFSRLARLGAENERFDVVIVDPPAFVKTKKSLASGVKGYRKLAALAAPLVAPGGLLFFASCSHHVDATTLLAQVREGLRRSNRSGRLLCAAGAAPDHPVHPFLPESAYLKALTFALD